MQISPTAAASVTTTTAASEPRFRPGPARDGALLDLHGVGFFRLYDSLTGYGRQEGYDSLANARRAAYQLTKGAESPAAGIYQTGERFFVRSIVTAPGRSPHAADAGAAGPDDAASAARALLHFEGNADAHFGWVRDNRLVMLVDGATKIWSRDAHHPAPAA